jgi:hypothetical protein
LRDFCDIRGISPVLKSIQTGKALDAGTVIAGREGCVLISRRCIDLQTKNSATTQTTVGAGLPAMAD